MNNYIPFIILIFSLSCESLDNEVLVNNCDSDYSTAGILTDIDESLFNDDESVNGFCTYSWTYDGTSRILN